MKTLTIIDTFGFLFRSFYALPPLKNSEGFPTGLLTGFANFISNIYKEHSTDYLVFALDCKGKSFRNEIDENYKAHRPDVPEDLLKQLAVAIEWIDKMGFATLVKEGYEADDIVATVAKEAKEAKEKGYEVRIVSHDKDLYQLIDEGITMYDPIKKRDIDKQACIDKFGVTPEQFIDYQAMVGDSADNVPGVKGVGAKTAQKLIEQFGSLEKIYENIDLAGTKRVKNLLLEGRESAKISKELVTLKKDVPVEVDVEQFALVPTPLQRIEDELQKYDLKQVLTRINGNGNGSDKPKLEFDAVLLDTKEKLFDVTKKLTPSTVVAFDTETTDLDTKGAQLVGFSFCFEQKRSYYVPVAHTYLGVGQQVALEDALEGIRQIFEAKLVGQNLKYDLEVLLKYELRHKGIHADTMVLSWLQNPGLKHGLDAQAKRWFDYTMMPFKSLVKKGETFANVEMGKACFYGAEDSWMTYLLFQKYQNLLPKKFFDIAKEVENPFIDVLISMEQLGIKVDLKRLDELEKFTGETLAKLTAEIYELTGSEFNIKSTQQLGSILFEKLGLKGAKKTKTGFSTNEQVLQGLLDEHPVIEKLLEYREIQKIESTYVKPLKRYAKDSRVYTHFLHTGTATGRLSSQNPNLQNIPTRSSVGRRVRECFVAKEGYTLLGIDYSQIELRLLAHFSGDKALVEAFNNDEDIHMATATKLFGEEAKQKRNFAKSINFGLIYGMGSRKLSQELGITTKEAKTIIEDYFAAFSSVKGYLESIEEQAKRDGFVETLIGRKRFFDFESANAMMQNAYLRESVNTVFQGSAADLIKLSMNSIYEQIKNDEDADMLLQIHDELIFEVREGKEEHYGNLFQKTMEEIKKLKVPLKTSLAVAQSWGELK